MRSLATALTVLAAQPAAADPFTVAYDASFRGFQGLSFPLASFPNENFAIARNESLRIEAGLQAFERFGDGLDNSDERYFAPIGNAPTSPADPTPSVNAAWNINWAVILPSRLRDWDVDLRVDFDPAADASEFFTFDANTFLDGLGLASVASSQNIGAAFWQLPQFGAPPFDANRPGEYDIELVVRDLDGAIAARSAIVVEVVPAPGTGALIALAAVGAARRRR